MNREFEDPRKTLLRERFVAALDAAGYEIGEEPEPIVIPGATGLHGRIVPDVQSVDSNGRDALYCLRPSASKPLPQWLAKWARAAVEMGLDLYVVVDDAPSSDLERSCRAAGAGLLLLQIDGMQIVVDAGEVPEELRNEECIRRVSDLRRRLDNKLRLHLDAIESDFTNARSLTAEMPDDVQDDYVSGITEHGERWREWGEDISEALDAILASCEEDEFVLIEETLAQDPV